MKPETLYVLSREEWRRWLSENFDKKKEIWLVYPNKVSGKPRIEYNTAVEEALCFGWIDSNVKSLDEQHSIQRFSVRRDKSNYSQANKERIKWLYSKELIHPSVKDSVEWIVFEAYVFPEDIIAAIRKDDEAWNNYQKFSESYKRIRIAYIDSARKRPEVFDKRLGNFIGKTRENKLIRGFGGIDKYY